MEETQIRCNFTPTSGPDRAEQSNHDKDAAVIIDKLRKILNLNYIRAIVTGAVSQYIDIINERRSQLPRSLTDNMVKEFNDDPIDSNNKRFKQIIIEDTLSIPGVKLLIEDIAGEKNVVGAFEIKTYLPIDDEYPDGGVLTGFHPLDLPLMEDDILCTDNEHQTIPFDEDEGLDLDAMGFKIGK